ncbi:diamine N-acetyltransferase [Janibacter hoylei PVAS-1]|uniref:N-acetyltransferase n=1 Tax=Janibacter hoylei PVAS-1 TaxID=1210046 RepID=K1EQ68_9MICO|nr:GNAT family protein [Janibacter hoylei]EKA61348.1 diamine N-acetyltransferase [Janibacter hoylei PVAS-1]RWU84462.1 N-acetyltransferase [Janibacter hoylei PVAS-1]
MIYGKRTALRPIETSDQGFVHDLNADPAVRGKVVGWDWPSSLTAQERWFSQQNAGTTHRWLVTTHENEPLGLTGIWDVDWHNSHALTALKLGGTAPMRGRGYGTDAIMAVMAFAFYDVGLTRLHGAILADNEASRRAYVDKCGWSVEGVARKHIWRHGSFVDLLYVGVLKSDFDNLADSADYRRLIVEGHIG